MESNTKIIILMLTLLFSLSVMAGRINVFPDDIPTIEALIDAHKKMKKAEDIAVLELSFTAETQDVTKNIAAKYNQTRRMLNQRLSDVGSALTLVSSIASVAIQLKNLTESYAEFTETTYKNAKRQPFLLMTYTSANIQIANEIKRIANNIGEYTAFQTNVFKATMEEKRQLLGFISANIASVQRIINRTTMMCRSMLATGVKEYHVYDIINSQTNKDIMNKIIGKWTGNAQK